MNRFIKKAAKGFTLIEILVVIGIIAILAAIVIIAINPARQFALARNSQRTSDVSSILNAIGQNIADNKGIFTCAAGAIPTAAATDLSKSGGYDIRPCIVPKYISEIPNDPGTATGLTGNNTCVDTVSGDCASGSYDTTYKVQADTNTGRITVIAPNAELSQSIKITR